MPSNLEWLHQQSQQYDHLYIALSGGEDSTALVHAISQHRSKFSSQVSAVHINHLIQPQSNDWANHCQNFCNKINMPIDILTAPQPRPKATETEARNIRISLLSSFVKGNAGIVTAHHLNDQIETFWVQLKRGEKNHALSGMKSTNKVHGLRFIRPWLNLPKQLIKKYIAKHNLKPIKDPMNQDNSIIRNRIRNQWLPLVESTFPNHAQEVVHFQKFLAQQSFLPKPQSQLCVNTLINLPKNQQLKTFISWLHHHQCYHFSQQQCLTFIQQLTSPPDKSPTLSHSTKTIQRFNNKLYALTNQQVKDQVIHWNWHKQPRITLPDNLGILEVTAPKSSQLPRSLVIKITPSEPYQSIQSNRQSISIKKIFNASKIPPWGRKSYPKIILNNDIICLPNIPNTNLQGSNIDLEIIFYPNYHIHYFYY
ncbi:MAG TPA: tRNA lysidine(34) synthetase TilS [Gammaproteobacteria bacterium]|nr:tRNA lysidine(34) synthetase TilS [Gammaproteobacteria bacterium]